MRALAICMGLCVFVTGFTLAETPEERVRRVASLTYIHGITQDIADQIGPEGLPQLFALMNDEAFERRDNVIALLGFLAYDTDTPRLTEFFNNPPVSTERPEDYRSLLLVPDALGRIASRGGALAGDALVRMAEAPEVRDSPVLAEMVDFGRSLAANQEVTFEPGETEPPHPEIPGNIDGQANIHWLNLTYANHVNTNSPISDQRVDDLLQEATEVIGTEDAPTDTACCVQLGRITPGGTFGFNGDGLDVITTSSEMNQVLYNGVARVKVVDSISWCGGSGANIIGCGATPGNGIALVRLSSAFSEGLLWAHELGHNTGLGHNAASNHIMSPSLSSNNTRLTTGECNTYHFPSGSAGIPNQVVGSCSDSDGDGVMSSTDNCPTVSNGSQTNSDGDSLGNFCDNCDFTDNPDQADCDGDGAGDVCDSENIPADPIENVEFPQPNRLRWDAEDIEKRVYRGSLVAGNPWPFNETLEATLPDTSNGYQDTDLPVPGSLYYYQIKPFNGCGEGP